MSETQIIPGAEPYYHIGNRIGVLVSHGYTGCPQSMRYIAEGLAKEGFSVILPRLKGHGTSPADMATATASDWTTDILTAYGWLKERCDHIFMTGLSMGGTLTLVAAGLNPEGFSGIIPINASVILNNPDLLGLAFLPGMPSEIPGIGSDIKAPGITEIAYPVVPVPTIKEVLALTKGADELMARITCPALIFSSTEDHVVPPMNAEYILNKLSSAEKRIVKLENSYHVATLDNDKDLILQESIAFIKAHS
ncbi:MAG: alpha/beta fold hydrolase [Chloroflexi bacterium]|uniref:Alpha/beta fold hydrolase n=1 Tax=Candidatus Chlorohelix allophototropha TaxID=3003348 RepID=A0A8T7M5J8_9CHLR|nr:alpha/beta fold hydrolase [Chloroflexota bacterium]WJW69268.1 alpha/beta fold hydrolase [Chloroflexota bacterium L227-S17]